MRLDATAYNAITEQFQRKSHRSQSPNKPKLLIEFKGGIMNGGKQELLPAQVSCAGVFKGESTVGGPLLLC
ncbi:hypothetical protein SAMN05421863_106712 [Nitrosomonas communis]|uniref:Uncharacterized protein n=1 Tax=Nitrosomonas communis TaxID=44574 RepID=A0A1I4UNA4_9PROT|nr:hypothetical protein SAMN05421863_106712 [Nitrosomonas communis]